MRPTFNPPSTSRRAMLSTTAFVAPAAALAACGLVTPANVATVESVIAKIQSVMPYVSGIANALSLVVPGASAIAAVVNTGLSTAASIFATMSTTMTAAAAQPVVGQIATYLSGALTSAKSVITLLPSAAQTTANNLLAEADTVIGEINSFVNPTVSAPAVAPTLPVHMFVRNVK